MSHTMKPDFTEAFKAFRESIDWLESEARAGRLIALDIQQSRPAEESGDSAIYGTQRRPGQRIHVSIEATVFASSS